ncbi:MAG: EI24 domain-containing protein [Sulfuriferula sp.]|nr:EI24 domain-containing protein [Sulfuriferula sp.]
MNDIFVALTAAAKSLFHPRILAIVLWPMIFALVLWGVLAWVFWADWLALLNHWMQPAELFLSQYDFTWLASMLTVIMLLLLITPLALTTALLIAAVVAMPMMVNHVARRDFPNLERRHGGTAMGSLWNALVAVGVFAALWLLTLPIWLLAGLGAVFSVLLMAYLNQRLFRYDALAEHASRAEFAAILEQSGGSLYALGLILALLHFIPVINLISPIYTGLAYIHFGLAKLRQLRNQTEGKTDETIA